MLAFAWWVTHDKAAKPPKSKVGKLSFAGCNLELNMLKTLLIIPSSTFQKFTHYPYCILISLPIIPILFYCINIPGMY